MIFSNIWKMSTIGAGILLVLALGWAMRLNSLRAGWEEKHAKLDGQAQSVLLATRQATNNPELQWLAVPVQITALASSNLTLKLSIDRTNATVEAMDAETKRLKAAGDALRSEIGAVQASRQSAIAQLKAMSLAPGDRTSCPALLSQAQDALDLAWGSGL